MLLVDHFATSWGTNHLPSGKGVWFLLTRNRSLARQPNRPMPPIAAPSAAALAALARCDLSLGDPSTIEIRFGRLLSRLCGASAALGAVVRLDQADGAGLRPVAEYGEPVGDGDSERLVREPLPVSWPWRGELLLVVAHAPSPYAAPLAELMADRLGLALENERLRRTDLRRQAWLTFLAEVSELLAQSLDIELTKALIPRLVVPRLGSWCAVYGLDGWGEPKYAAAAHLDETVLPDLLDQLGTEAATAGLRDAVSTGAHVPLSAPLDGLAVPLVARGQQLGLLLVGRHPDHRQHDPEELGIIDDLARRFALAIDNARIYAERHRVAQTLQRSLLPPALPEVEGIGFGAEYVPTAGDAEVGGDFYDLVPMADGRWLVVVGDVSGKGVQAATVTGLVRDVVRILVRDGRPVAEIISRINETLVERGGGRYCTLAMAAVARGAHGQLEVTLFLAGHDRPVLVGADGKASFVGTPGTALGLLPTIKSPSLGVALAPGDTMIFYTDGITERRRGAELFGVERLRAAAGTLAGFDASAVATRLRATAMAFSPEPPRDDIAILALRNDS
jgi:serine phosphatase RsbU (regulator of sigma subunit)